MAIEPMRVSSEPSFAPTEGTRRRGAQAYLKRNPTLQSQSGFFPPFRPDRRQPASGLFFPAPQARSLHSSSNPANAPEEPPLLWADKQDRGSIALTFSPNDVPFIPPKAIAL